MRPLYRAGQRDTCTVRSQAVGSYTQFGTPECPLSLGSECRGAPPQKADL